MTGEGYRALDDQLKQLKSVERPSVIAAMFSLHGPEHLGVARLTIVLSAVARARYPHGPHRGFTVMVPPGAAFGLGDARGAPHPGPERRR